VVVKFPHFYSVMEIVISTAKTVTDSSISYCRFNQPNFVPQMLSVYVTYIYPWESNNERVAYSNYNMKNTLATKNDVGVGGGGGRCNFDSAPDFH